MCKRFQFCLCHDADVTLLPYHLLFNGGGIENSNLVVYSVGTLTKYICMQIGEHAHGLHSGELSVDPDTVCCANLYVGLLEG